MKQKVNDFLWIAGLVLFWAVVIFFAYQETQWDSREAYPNDDGHEASKQ